MNVLVPRGNIGPAEAAELKRELLELCSAERPLVHVDLSQVDELHLTAANSIIRAALEAQRRRGSLTVSTSDRGSARSTLARTGLYHQLEP